MPSWSGSGEVSLPGCRLTVYGTISMVRKGLESSLGFLILRVVPFTRILRSKTLLPNITFRVRISAWVLGAT